MCEKSAHTHLTLNTGYIYIYIYIVYYRTFLSLGFFFCGGEVATLQLEE